MPRDYLHNHAEFADLIRIVAREKSIDPALVEKDYWLMHCLYGLQKQGFKFELKGGTSLSKGYGAIERFSEDIDIQIEPPEGHDVKIGRNQNKPVHDKTERTSMTDWRQQSASTASRAWTATRSLMTLNTTAAVGFVSTIRARPRLLSALRK